MSLKDLQFNIGKLTSKVKTQVAKNNPLQDQDARALNLWLFEERNHLAMSKTTAFHENETNRAFLEWIQEDLAKNKDHDNYCEDMEAVGSSLYQLLCKQVELENQYNERYILYRRAIKSMRDKEKQLSDAKAKQQALTERIEHLNKSNPTSKKLPELTKELEELNLDDQERESIEFKRFILKEGFYLRFNAMQEHAEKMAIIAGYGKYLVDLLDANEHASSNCDMILKDALLSIEHWEPKDKRQTLTEEDMLFEHDDDEHDDAILLTDKEIKIKQKAQSSSSSTANPAKHDYYHALYRRMSEQEFPTASQNYRPYKEFQHQYRPLLKNYVADEKREFYDEVPPPAYYSDDNKSKVSDIIKQQ